MRVIVVVVTAMLTGCSSWPMVSDTTNELTDRVSALEAKVDNLESMAHKPGSNQ